MSYFRKNIERMSGYTPGEQPQITDLIKLNTNENPYAPSAACLDILNNFDPDLLRRYPDPLAKKLVAAIAAQFDVSDDMIIVGNGSDDILNIAMRCFGDEQLAVGCLEPSYSLYPVLAEIQNTKCVKIPLREDFSAPDNLAELANTAKINIFFLTRPNAPVGNALSLEEVENFCRDFSGIVLIDEAYADFASDNCLHFVKRFDNVIISRSLSKSYSLAGLRFGFALANAEIISGMMKVRDSYNTDAITQQLAFAALKDQGHLNKNCRRIIAERESLAAGLRKINFSVIDSQANFLFVSPPDSDGKKYFDFLREHAIIVRYFPSAATDKYVRISIGTPAQMQKLLEVTGKLYS